MAFYQTPDEQIEAMNQAIGANIQKFIQNVTVMTKLVNLIGTEHDNENIQAQFEQYEEDTTKLAKETSKLVKNMHRFSISSVATDGKFTKRQWRDQKDRLQTEFTNALRDFEAAKKVADEREEEVTDQWSKSAANMIQMQKMHQNDASKTLTTGTTQTVQRPESSLLDTILDVSDADLLKRKLEGRQHEEQVVKKLLGREASLKQLESDIKDMNDIFKQLATMVDEQGEKLDVIEENVQTAEVAIHEGVEKLAEAEGYLNAARKKKLFILVVVVIIVLAITIGLIIWGTS